MNKEVKKWINLSEYYLSKKDYKLARTSYVNAIDEYNKSDKEIDDAKRLKVIYEQLSTFKEPKELDYAKIAIIVLILLLPLVLFGNLTGFTALVDGVVEEINEVSESVLGSANVSENVTIENETTAIIENGTIGLKLNVLNYSCKWNGSLFNVCESVEWSGGSYGSGYITGGEAANKAERFTVSPFTYCQDVENEGKKAVNAYVLDEKEKIIKQDLTHDVDCIIGNETIVTISNESVDSNLTVVQNESNITEVNVTDLNITTVTIETNESN